MCIEKGKFDLFTDVSDPDIHMQNKEDIPTLERDDDDNPSFIISDLSSPPQTFSQKPKKSMCFYIFLYLNYFFLYLN